MSNNNEVRASLVLNHVSGLGPKMYQGLMNHFGSAEEALIQGPSNWQAVLDLDLYDVNRFQMDIDEANRTIDHELKLIEKENIQIKLWQAPDYPAHLKEISHPPPVLYVRGDDISRALIVVAVVGSRRSTYYGEKMARRLSEDLASVGIVTVSGLARGIDSCVHRATINAQGKTWAVIGSGLLEIYPPENRKLADEISASGALISEFPLQTKPLPCNFPRRNRIIAGISVITIVIEGTIKSGSLITARLALDEGREVMAVPGLATNPMSGASHYLIRHGAKLIQTIDDILEELPVDIREKMKISFEAPGLLPDDAADDVKQVFAELTHDPISKDDLAVRLNKSPQELSALLFQMEIQGWAKSLPGGTVVKS